MVLFRPVWEALETEAAHIAVGGFPLATNAVMELKRCFEKHYLFCGVLLLGTIQRSNGTCWPIMRC
jgi:hypothetical protein